MTHSLLTRFAVSVAVVAATVLSLGSQLAAQSGAGAPADAPPPTAKAAAPIDLTGNWVAVVSEDWRFRMVTPPKGDYQGVPVTTEARKIADAWDPVKDQAAGEQCRSYGAPAIMRVPGRVRISWLDDNTLKLETDAGIQTRLFHFGSWKPAPGPATWQGESVAEWEPIRPPAGAAGAAGAPGAAGAAAGATGGTPPAPRFGNLKVVTRHLRPGYLRKNGVPYSADTVMTEYWDLLRPPNGDLWVVITTLVSDPKYLQRDWMTSLNFKKEPDGSKWDPAPCSAAW
jgi:hypothetical protein